MVFQKNQKEIRFPQRKKGKLLINLSIILIILTIVFGLGLVIYTHNMAATGNTETLNTLEKNAFFINSVIIMLTIIFLCFLIYGVHLYYKKNLQIMQQ